MHRDIGTSKKFSWKKFRRPSFASAAARRAVFDNYLWRSSHRVNTSRSSLLSSLSIWLYATGRGVGAWVADLWRGAQRASAWAHDLLKSTFLRSFFAGSSLGSFGSLYMQDMAKFTYGHTLMRISHPVRSAKSSICRLSQ